MVLSPAVVDPQSLEIQTGSELGYWGRSPDCHAHSADSVW